MNASSSGAVARRALPRTAIAAVLALLVVALGFVVAAMRSGTAQPSAVPASLLPDGRRLTPAGTQVPLGNLPTGGAVTADARFLWTVSAGFASNDVRIVDTAAHRVCQVLDVPGASGGIALDSAHRLAYVSGLANSRWQPSKNGLAGATGDDVLVYSWGTRAGRHAWCG